jgi:hypothetical protein
MDHVIQTDSPAYQLPFEKLPRGFVKFPEFIVQGIAALAAKDGFGEEYARESLVRHTLIWYYDGWPVAYRERPDGLEVLAVGWDETTPYELNREEGVKVVQP